MDKVTDVIEYVMAESIASDRCDDSDGKNKKSSENNDIVESKADCNTVNKSQLEKIDLAEEFSEMPSYAERYPLGHSSQEKSQSQTVLGVTTNLKYPSPAMAQPITVGDRVTIDDCPGHWSWASPFTVIAIEGNMAALEMVNEMVEMSRLEKCQR
ncbi:hypothetical protein [Pleurocapsa sp. PCC 7319]|uniref:hypothetical protein n=1 Tax=Pleurocapsa sp. PCC 7319 TaxID=118161 RepID=UPI00130E01BC|nr:hypothetical protein [Pleurocapsa sp. PCC 7319]